MAARRYGPYGSNKAGEQIATMFEQSLLYQILDTAWRKRRSAVLFRRRQFLAQAIAR